MTSQTARNDVDVDELLRSYNEPVVASLDRYLPDREPAAYLYDLIADYPRRPAKGLRPAILIASCLAHGGTIDDALLPAVSIELLHNALLVHDDFQDGSDLRRGKPALHHLVGAPLAVNAGDALAMFALQPLHESIRHHGTRLGEMILDEFHRMTRYSLEGQALELGWTRDNVVDLDDQDYLRLIMLKTCWYTTIYPMRVGAIVGSRGRADLDAFIEFGWFLGAAFQIRDDLLNLIGADDSYGKEALGDLLEGKRTLPLVHLLRSAPSDVADQARELLSTERSERTEAGARWLLDRMREHGSIAYTEAFASGIADAAHEAFASAYGPLPDSEAKRFMRALIGYMLERQS